MDINKLVLADIIDLVYLQKLQDSFANVTGMTAMLLDAQGTPLTKFSRLNTFCQDLRGTEEGVRFCSKVHRDLLERNRNTRLPAMANCPKTGLTMAAVPIFIEDQHLASWVIGQAKVDRFTDAKVAEISEETGYPAEDLQMYYEGLPQVSQDEFDRIFVFFNTLSETIVTLVHSGHDTTRRNAELMDLADQLRRSAAMLSRFIDSADVGLYVCDFYTGELLLVNEKYAQYTGRSSEQLIGQPCWKVFGPNNTCFCDFCPVKKLLDKDNNPCGPYVWESEIEGMGAWLRLTHQATYWLDDRLVQMVTFVDITETKLMQDQLSQLAFYDRDLRLPNDLKLERDIQRLEAGEDISLICFDILSLSKINEGYSREAGDVLLRSVSDWVQDLIHNSAQLYRIDGDEFCLSLVGADEQQAEELAQQIYVRFEEPWDLRLGADTLTIFCSVTMGVVHQAKQYFLSDHLINVMERTLEFSRKEGCIVIHNEESDRQRREQLRLEMSLRNCVREDMHGFDVHYQPIVDPITGIWCSLEALCRWNSPEFGPISPLVFIEAAEQMGLINKIGYWVLETAIRHCKQWGLDEHERFILDVNLSPAQLMDDRLVPTIMAILEKYNYPGSKLSLEITESIEMNFTNHTLNAIERLHRHGILVALDDFGTGYSSFNNLKNLPVNILKTEKVFIDNIENDTYLQYLLYLMVELAHAADMKLIAEGVENEEQMMLLLKNGVDFLQGYLFSKPLPPAELEKNLDRFFQVSERFAERRNHTEFKTLLKSSNSYVLPPQLYKALHECIAIMLEATDIDNAIQAVLEMMGTQMNISRAYIFLRDNKLEQVYSNIYEWCAPGIFPIKDSMISVNVGKNTPIWIKCLEEDGIIVSSDTSRLPEEIYEQVCIPQLIKAIAVLPMQVEGELSGFIGFDDCHFYRDWQQDEIVMLNNLCSIMASILERKARQQKLEERIRLLDNILDNMSMSVYVSDVESGRVIYSKDVSKEDIGPDGLPRWEQVDSGAVQSGLIKQTLPSQESNSPHWENQYRRGNRFYQVYDSLIPSERGGNLHLEYAVDITSLKKYQKQLERVATTDVVTGTLNRFSLLENLRIMLRKAFAFQIPVSLVYIDIDNMRYINDTYGHASGDELIASTVLCLQQSTRKEDLLGRYSGDEFVLALPNCPKEMASRKTLQALKKLREKGLEKNLDFSFNYGVVENSELPFSDAESHVDELLEMAVHRLHASQKSSHVPPPSPTST